MYSSFSLFHRLFLTMTSTQHWFPRSILFSIWNVFTSNIPGLFLWPLRRLFITFSSTAPNGEYREPDDEERLQSVGGKHASY